MNPEIVRCSLFKVDYWEACSLVILFPLAQEGAVFSSKWPYLNGYVEKTTEFELVVSCHRRGNWNIVLGNTLMMCASRNFICLEGCYWGLISCSNLSLKLCASWKLLLMLFPNQANEILWV